MLSTRMLKTQTHQHPSCVTLETPWAWASGCNPIYGLE